MTNLNDGIERTTAQVAALLAIPVATVRYWVRCKLVTPVKEVNHTYLFSPTDVERFRYIHQRRLAGIGLEQIKRELSMFSWHKPELGGTEANTDTSDVGSTLNTTGASPRVIVLANQKGGVGKTTSAINLGAALVEQGQTVLVIDWDPQANASQALGLTHEQTEGGPSVFDCVGRDDLLLTQVIRPTGMPGLDLASANIQLSGLELDLANSIGRESALRAICQRQPLLYDYVIIDTPPTLGLITINALVAGEWVVIPVQAEYLSLEGVRQLINTVDIVKRRLNPSLTLAAVLITMYSESEPLAAQIRLRIQEVFGNRVHTALVPRSAHVIEAQMQGIPVALHQPESTVAQAYRAVAAELIHKNDSMS